MRQSLPATKIVGAILAILALAAGPPRAFEIETEQYFAAVDGSSEITIMSTADLSVFAPLVRGFQNRNPRVSVRYVVLSSAELYSAVLAGEAAPDLVISSAMDLQTKLANDGFAQPFRSQATETLPAWARWRDELFAFTLEPAVLILSKPAFADLPRPKTRQDLIELLRDNPERFKNRIGTYDLRTSGLGYLFGTQDTRQSETFWRLSEVMGALQTRLYCCSGQMIEDVRSGELALAYNVLGSYADAQDESNVDIVLLEDYTSVMMRTALIPNSAKNAQLAGTFINYLLSTDGRALLRAEIGPGPLDTDTFSSEQNLRPIRLGPGLLVYLDQLKRQSFLRAWASAIIQP
ncbi:MAG TPA: ABC transporter substrate-binding protein [Devosia sp.]|nr:ABC transporter substrate-binding protein [Devosia sp.]